MKTDYYTKSVLTVIAICLVLIVIKQMEFIPTANAETNLGIVKGVNYGLVPLNADGSIDVNIKSNTSTIDVDIVEISTMDEMDVNIDEVGGHATHGTVPVKVK